MNIKRKRKPLAEVTSQAIEILSRELGPADTIRFIGQFSNGHGDYTSERDTLFEGVTLDQIVAESRRSRESRESESGQ